MYHAHTAASATGRRLQHNGNPYTGSFLQGNDHAVQLYLAVFYQWNISGAGKGFGGHFIAQLRHHFRSGAYENDAFFPAAPGKLYVLAQEPVTRVNGVYLVLFGQVDDTFNIEIRFKGL